MTFYTPAGFQRRAASPSGGGAIKLDSFGNFDIGGGALAALSGSSITLESRNGSIIAGRGQEFSQPLVSVDPFSGPIGTGLIGVNYTGSGIAAPGGTVSIVAKRGDIDVGAGIRGAGVNIQAGGNVLAGSGSIQSSGDVHISAGGVLSANVSAAGSVNVSASGGTSGNVASTGGLVSGASSASNTGAGRSSAETEVASNTASSGAGFRSAAAAVSAARRAVMIDVSSRPCTDDRNCP